jgi:hypothetical protein
MHRGPLSAAGPSQRQPLGATQSCQAAGRGRLWAAAGAEPPAQQQQPSSSSPAAPGAHLPSSSATGVSTGWRLSDTGNSAVNSLSCSSTLAVGQPWLLAGSSRSCEGWEVGGVARAGEVPRQAGCWQGCCSAAPAPPCRRPADTGSGARRQAAKAGDARPRAPAAPPPGARGSWSGGCAPQAPRRRAPAGVPQAGARCRARGHPSCLDIQQPGRCFTTAGWPLRRSGCELCACNGGRARSACPLLGRAALWCQSSLPTHLGGDLQQQAQQRVKVLARQGPLACQAGKVLHQCAVEELQGRGWGGGRRRAE